MGKGKIWSIVIHKLLKRSSPSFAQVIISGVPNIAQNFIQIGRVVLFLHMRDFAPPLDQSWFGYFLDVFFHLIYRQDEWPHRFWCAIRLKMLTAQGYAFWITLVKFWLVDSLCPKLPFCIWFRLDKFSPETALTLEMLACKRPLIVILAS